ncbi:MAG TPA: hypothetical protein VEQ60_05770 [Longimicrobium sp.]|nr:hypothetical protein [Longimicrobium sp.]
MPRPILLLAAAALAAAPSSAQPSRPVDECGKPATPSRPRRSTAPPVAATPPHLLGTPTGRGAETPSTPTSGTPTSPGAQLPPTSGADPAPAPPSTGLTCTALAASAGYPGAIGAFGGNGSSAAEPAADRRTASLNRDALRLGLDDLGDRMRLGPAASVSVPTAFGVDAGELFFGIAYQGRTRYTEEDDGAAVIGIGVGSRRVVAVEAALTTYSTFRSNPLETGGVSVKVHRMLPRSTSVAVGYENAFLWGGSDDNGSLYAVATRMMNLREDADAPFSTAVFTLGLGNGRFRFEDDDAEGKETVNLFAAAGARVTPHVSLVADWTGQDLNMAASLTPLPRVPVVLTLGLADLTGSAGDGARFILSLGYGLAFRQMF